MKLDYNRVVEKIEKLENITSVCFGDIYEAKFPTNIGKLKQIKKLDVTGIPVGDLPADIVNLADLEELICFEWDDNSGKEFLDELRHVLKAVGEGFFTKWILPTIEENELEKMGGLSGIKKSLSHSIDLSKT